MDSEVRNDTMRHVGPEVAPRMPGPRTPEVAPPGYDAAGDHIDSHDGSPETSNPYTLAAMVSRLSTLGATLDEIALVEGSWDDPWEPGAREAFFAMSDADLLAEIRGTREEFEHDTLTEDEQADVDFRRAVDAARPEAENQTVHGSIDGVLSWVDGDRVRAQAALESELAQSEPRKTLVPQLERLASGWAAPTLS